MTIGQVVVTVSLLARVYGVDPALMDCMVYRESSYNVNAVNGIHIGVAQFNPDTYAWMAHLALGDPVFMHKSLIEDGKGPGDGLSALVIMSWAFKNDMGEHWSTYSLCIGERNDE